jgi:hypothetical protein
LSSEASPKERLVQLKRRKAENLFSKAKTGAFFQAEPGTVFLRIGSALYMSGEIKAKLATDFFSLYLWRSEKSRLLKAL